jgi:hypothetical protein
MRDNRKLMLQLMSKEGPELAGEAAEPQVGGGGGASGFRPSLSS